MVSRSRSGRVCHTFALVLTATTLAAGTGCVAAPEEKLGLVIGANLELSGDDAQLGRAHRNAMELALTRRAMSGVDVTVVYRDNAGDPERAGEITRAMLADGEIDVIVGGVTAPVATALSAAASGGDKPVMLLAPDAAPVDPSQTPSVFTTGAGPDVIADVTLSQLREAGAGRVSVLASNDAYGRSGSAELQGRAPDFEIEVLDSQTYSPQGEDLDEPVGAVGDDGADAIVVWSHRALAGRLAGQLRDAGLDENPDRQVFFAPGAGSQTLLAQPDADGMSLICPTIVVAGSVAATTPRLAVQREFFTEYTSRFGAFVPDAAVASDAVGIFAQAAAAASSVDARQLREQLQDLSYSGVVGAYEFTGTRHSGLARSSFTDVTARSGSWSQA